jgi:hypothetical protein
MIIIPIEENTIPLVTAISGGVEPKVDSDTHHSFIYHGVDIPFEIVPTVMVGIILADGNYDAVMTRVIVKP